MAKTAVAFLDEAGEKGFIRNLNQSRDASIALLCGLVFPLERIDEFRESFEPPFKRFKQEAGGKLKKLHITDAFKPGNEELRPMAVDVRDAIFGSVRAKQVPVIYTARRMKLLREAHVNLENIKQQGMAQRQNKDIAIPKQPSDARIEEDLIIGLTLRLDAFARDFTLDLIELATDQIDLPVAAGLTESMDAARSISFSKTVVKGYDLKGRKPVHGTITFSVPNSPFELDVKHVGALTVVGKDDPLVFATDVVVNALNSHLVSLPATNPLNAPSSVAGWSLEDHVWGVLDGAMEDII